MAHKPIVSRKLKVFRTHIGFDDLIVAAPSRKAALEAWGASAHLFTQGFATETHEPALVKSALARPGMVLRRQFGSQGEFRAERPALRPVETPLKAKPQAAAKAPGKKLATNTPAERNPLDEAMPADHLAGATRSREKRAQREQAAAERAERRAADVQARAEARQREAERKQAAAELRRDLQSRLQSLQAERRQQLRDMDRRELELARERREIEQSFETRIVTLQRQLRKA